MNQPQIRCPESSGQIIDDDLAASLKHLRSLVQSWMPALLDQPGVGPVSAAQLLVTWSHPGRFRSEAAFAALTGTSPIPASSGRTARHRINPYGDRNANRALHTIAISRLRYHQPPSPTPPAAPAKAKPPARSAAASSATSPATSTA